MRKFLAGISLLFVQSVMAQSPADTSATQRNMLNYFYNAISENSLLYNGRHYQKYPYRTEGDPFFIKNEWLNGNINYEGVPYNTRLMFDMEKNKLVIPFYTDDRILVELVTEKVTSFSIDGHRFVQLNDTVQRVPSGFYEIIFDGKTQLLAHRKKHTNENFNNLIRISYTETVTYYLQKNGQYIKADRPRELLRILADKEKELKKFIRQNKFTFTDDKENEMIRVVEYYNQLTK